MYIVYTILDSIFRFVKLNKHKTAMILHKIGVNFSMDISDILFDGLADTSTKPRREKDGIKRN